MVRVRVRARVRVRVRVGARVRALRWLQLASAFEQRVESVEHGGVAEVGVVEQQPVALLHAKVRVG